MTAKQKEQHFFVSFASRPFAKEFKNKASRILLVSLTLRKLFELDFKLVSIAMVFGSREGGLLAKLHHVAQIFVDSRGRVQLVFREQFHTPFELGGYNIFSVSILAQRK